MLRSVFILFLFIAGCSSSDEGNARLVKKDRVEAGMKKKDSVIVNGKDAAKMHERKISSLEIQLRNAGLVNVHDLDSTIKVDLRYSTTENFVGMDVYGDFDQCYLQ